MHEKFGTNNFPNKLIGFRTICMCVHLLSIVTSTSEKRKDRTKDNYRVPSCAYWRMYYMYLKGADKFICRKIEQRAS